MFPIADGSYDCWNYLQSTFTQPYPGSQQEAAGPETTHRKIVSLIADLAPRTTQAIECTAKIKSLAERVLLHITDFFTTSVSLLTKKAAIERDLKDMLDFPHKIRQGNWSRLFEKRCAEAKWYGVDLDAVIHGAFVGMGRQAAGELKKLIMEDGEHDWLKSTVMEREKKQAEALLKIDNAITKNNAGSSSEIERAISESIGFGCNPSVIIDNLIENSPANAQKILRICWSVENPPSILLSALCKHICLGLNADRDLFASVVETMDGKDGSAFFCALKMHSTVRYQRLVEINHLTWLAVRRFGNLIRQGHADSAYAEFEGVIESARLDDMTIRGIFSNAARSSGDFSSMGDATESHELNKYDKWLKCAHDVSSMSDAELEAAFSDVLGDETNEIGISPDRYSVLMAEAQTRAEDAHADCVGSLSQAVTNATALDSAALILPGVLVASEHAVRQARFEALGQSVVKSRLGEILDGQSAPDQQRFLQCFKYLCKRLEKYGKGAAADFLAKSLKQFVKVDHGIRLQEGDKKILSEMLSRHLEANQRQNQLFKFKKFTSEQREEMQKYFASQFETVHSLKDNASSNTEKPFCQQFVKDNRSFHVWINDRPMDGFSRRTDIQRSELIAEVLVSDLKATREQLLTISKICAQDVANQFFVCLREQEFFILDDNEMRRFIIDSALDSRAVYPIESPVEQSIRMGRAGKIEVKYFIYNDRLGKLRIEGGALHLDRNKSSFHGEITFAVEPNGNFKIVGDIRVGLNKKILRAE